MVLTLPGFLTYKQRLESLESKEILCTLAIFACIVMDSHILSVIPVYE
jgi:hypothetical protein